MKYKFKYDITALDLWKLSMHGTYRSMVGVSNIIFTIAMLLLTLRFWSDVNAIYKLFLIVGISLFPIIQPIGVYIRAKKQISSIPQDMEIGFDDKGMHIQTSKQNSDIKWNSIKRIIKKTNMIIIYSSSKHGFILTNRMMGLEREDFYNYVVSKAKR